jgi:hypothetical protein
VNEIYELFYFCVMTFQKCYGSAKGSSKARGLELYLAGNHKNYVLRTKFVEIRLEFPGMKHVDSHDLTMRQL